MSLEDQFSLGRSGGIYYNGTKVTPTDDPVLIVGLGGTGIDALLLVKNEVQSRMEPEINPQTKKVLSPVPGNIAFLAVDTDKEILKKSCGVATIKETSDEYVDISVSGLPDVIKMIVEQHIQEPQWNWYDPNLSGTGGIQGANGIRQIGRLMLFHNFSKVKARLEKIITDTITKAQDNSNFLNIFILTGIGGGTGSGTFIDMAYLLRTIAKAKTPNVSVHGYIFTPDLNKGNGGDVDSMYRNGFASMKELDYWMSMDEHKQHFCQAYPGDYNLDSSNRPFDYCHIITAQDAEHKILTYDGAQEAVAKTLFSYISGEQATDSGNTALKSMYDNIGGHLEVARMAATYPANNKYLSVGASALEIPYREIMTLLGARVFSRLEPVFHYAPTNESLNADLTAMQMTYDALKASIEQDIAGDPTLGKTFGYHAIVPNNTPYDETFTWLNTFAHQQLGKNAGNLQPSKEGLAVNYLSKLLGSTKRGPGYAARMISSNGNPNLISTLTEYQVDSSERAGTAASKLQMKKNALDQAFIAVKDSNVFTRSDAVKEYNKALKEWKECDYCFWMYTGLAEGIDKLIKRLQKYYDKIFHPLLEIISELPVIFKENVNTINANDNKIRADAALNERYLVLATDFERKHNEALKKMVDNAAVAFISQLNGNLERWVGRTLDGIDSDIQAASDIGACVSDLINSQFKEIVRLNIEKLLSARIPAGKDQQEYYKERLNKLRNAAVPMFHLVPGVNMAATLKSFALVSIPNDCNNIKIIADGALPEAENARTTSERSKLSWVSIQAGMPLFIFPEIEEMEKAYEKTMGNPLTRKGVHLRYEWREMMPSPLPEMSWPNSLRDSDQKAFEKARNQEIRNAYQICSDAGIIVDGLENNTLCRWLYLADDSMLEGVELFGTIEEKRDTIANLFSELWRNDQSRITLYGYGNVTNDTLYSSTCENTLRFYDACEKIKKQAEIYKRFKAMSDIYDNVGLFVHAWFAGLIRRKGFTYVLVRAQNDPKPIKLSDAMTSAAYPNFQRYRAFETALNTDRMLKKNIEQQFELAKGKLLDQNGDFIPQAIAEKIEIITALRNEWSVDRNNVMNRINNTAVEHRKPLLEVFDFYELAIETANGLLDIFQ